MTRPDPADVAPTALPTRRRALLRAGWGTLALLVLAVTLVAQPAPAGAATSSTLLYSTDGGTTWTSSATVTPGSSVLVRQWFANTGDDTLDGASATTTRPSTFSLAAGTTQVCLDPSTTDPTAPDATELACAAADEAAVWSGSDLSISPSAGHLGLSSGATSGPLAAGRNRFFNLHQCTIWDDRPTRNDSLVMLVQDPEQPDAGSNIAPTADTAPVCDPQIFALQPAMSGVSALPLFDRRYLNLQQCRWVDSGAGSFQRALSSSIADTADPTWAADTNTSNTSGAAPCSPAPTAGWTLTPAQSGVQSFDLLEDRYVNLFGCFWQSDQTASTMSHLATVADPTSAVSATGSADTPIGSFPSWPCPNKPFSIDPGGSLYSQSFDLLDTSRSAGYVTYELVAPTSPTPELCVANPPDGLEHLTQTASLTAPSTPVQTSSAELTVDWSGLLGDPCPADGGRLVDPAVAIGSLALAGAYLAVRRRRVTPA